MKQTVEIKKLESIAVLDSTSRIRNNFLDKWFLNGIDAIRFYFFAGKDRPDPEYD